MADINTNQASRIIPSIKKSSDSFSFIDTLSQAVTNKQFLEGKMQLDANEKTSYTYIWEALSAIGQDIGETLYSNVLNYIDNVCNIDVCKVSALKSMLKAYGIRYTLFDNLGIFPAKLADMLDLLSVNRRYLKDSKVFSRDFVMRFTNPRYGIASVATADPAAADRMLYQYYRSAITVSDDSHKDLPFLGKYVLSNDFSYNDAKCSVDVAGINTCREYVLGPVSKLYSSFNGLGQLPADYDDEQCMKQLSAQLSAIYKIKKFNVPLSGVEDQFYYGLYECGRKIDYAWKTYEKAVLTSTVSSDRDELMAVMFGFEEAVNADSCERVSFGPMFSYVLHPDRLSAMLIPFVEDTRVSANMSAAISAAEERARIISSTACDKSRLSVFEDNTSTEFEFAFEDNLCCAVDDIIVEDSSYSSFLSAVYYCHLSSMCTMPYVSDQTIDFISSISSAVSGFSELVQPIYQSLDVSAEFFPYQSNCALSSALDYKEFKQQNSIDLRFDEKKIVDDIEVGADSFDNYEGVQRILLENEAERRSQMLSNCAGSNSLSAGYNRSVQQTVFNTTRTNYYRRETVKKYIKFVEQCNYANDSNIFLSTYSIDDDYILVDNETTKYKPLLSIENAEDGSVSVKLDDSMLQNVAKFLADLTLYIAGIREKLKTQAVRYYMKGTFNLLSFIINEYLIEFSKNNNVLKYVFDEGSDLQKKYIEELSSSETTADEIREELAAVKSKLSSHMYVNVNVVEYDDLTEYYNLSSDKSSVAQNSGLVNARYWEGAEYGELAASQIQKFYESMLKNGVSLKPDQFDDFLRTLYDVGADPSYIDPVTKQFVIDGIHEAEDGTIDNQNKVDQSFMYIGTKDGMQPFYNIKNQTHPSYQVHPCLYNFVKATNQVYSIENAFKNGIVDDLIAENAQRQYDTNVGKYGEVIDIWKNNAYDFSGYRTSYEVGSHSSSIANGGIVECADYDGMFYPPALAEFMAAYHKYDARGDGKHAGVEELAAEVKRRHGSFYEKYYKHLNLVDNELSALSERLVQYADSIAEIAEEKQDADEVYDIYKYATDKFGNAYGLYKLYDMDRSLKFRVEDAEIIITEPMTYSIKENTLGQVWIRLKDTPIAFPAFAGKLPILQKKARSGGIENHIAWQLSDGSDGDKMCYFYDMEFDTTKQVMFLNCWPVNYVESSTAKGSQAAQSIKDNEEVLKKKEHSMVVVCCLKQERDDLTSEMKLYMTHDEVQNIDAFPNMYNQLIQKYKADSSSTLRSLAKDGKLELSSFLGLRKTVQSTDAVYVAKTYTFVDDGYVIAKNKPANEIIDVTRFKITMFRYTLSSIEDTFSHGPYSVNLRTFANGKYSDVVDGVLSAGYDIDSPTVRFNYSDDDMVFGFLSKRSAVSAENFIGRSAGDGGQMVYPNDTSGFALPLSELKETNSFDSLDKYVTILDAKILNDDIIFSDINLFNLNSDASYIPQYPGLIGKNPLHSTAKYGSTKSQKYKSIELLGQSKKINDIVSKIDPNSNVFVDVDMLQKLKDSMSGRVYEGAIDLDELLHVKSNPQLNPGDSSCDKLSAFEWKIPLDNFTVKDLPGVELMLFNDRAAGKNAYYYGTIQKLSAEGEPVSADNYISSDTTSEIKLSTDIADVYLAGTFNFFDNPVNKSDTNHLNNIQQIQIQFIGQDEQKDSIEEQTTLDGMLSALSSKGMDVGDGSTVGNIADFLNVTKDRTTVGDLADVAEGTDNFNVMSKSYLVVRFIKTDSTKRSYIHEDTVKIVLYNKFNLRQYEFYHYLDQRGIVKYDQTQSILSAYVDIHDLVFDDVTQKPSAEEQQLLEDYIHTVSARYLVEDEAAPEDAKYDKRYKWVDDVRDISSQKIYLRDIALSSYNYLSDVLVLKDKQNISFKYSEEDVFGHEEAQFYYPGYNKIYPSLNMSMFNVSASQVIDVSQLFDQSNLYITQMENSKTFADKIGMVDIPVEYNETNCLRVFEDYDRDVDVNDPVLLSCVHFTTTDRTAKQPTTVIDGSTFISVDVSNNAQSLDETIVNAQAFGFYGILTEDLSADFELDKLTINVTKAVAPDLKSLLDIYTSYEVLEGEKIRLFFNYYNYMNPPFIEIINGRSQVKAVDGTYLKLDPGESGLLDIDVQFKAYYGDNLYGLKTGTLVTYKIFNVSDDKPKFVIYKLSEIARGSLSDRGWIDADAVFSMVSLFVDLDNDENITLDGKILLKVKFVLESAETVAPGATFKIDYNLNELSFKVMNGRSLPGFTCEVVENKGEESFGHITLTTTQSMNMKSVILEGETHEEQSTIVTQRISSYDMTIMDIKATSVDGADIDFAKADGSIMFGYQVLLREEQLDNDNKHILVEQDPHNQTNPSFIVTRQT